ncbi:hypothetical protein GGR39_002383 [Novosphingobium fluoreni]|uniref:Uncharacterized protein n=1 Tax=Novosphingobium fluoreni TaxID=1391222 RepID=A0A7W6FYX8_9SPHN|nr:hypothetical protein [Novosphingobium fluoreni]MBB3940726.1 hypothetical protein [Novosphingobium fluoreni]
MTKDLQGTWWASRDGDFYTSGPHDTREQAIFAGREDFDGGAFHIVEAGIAPLRFSAARLIDQQYFEDDELFHPGASGADRRGNCKAADAELQEMLDAWLVRHADTFVAPTMFAWSRNEEFIPAGAVGEREAA